MSQQQWKDNIGEIILSDHEESFWMIPSFFAFGRNYCITSPKFSVHGKKWRLVLIPTDGCPKPAISGRWISLFLWKDDHSPLNLRYIVRLGIKTTDGRELVSCGGEILSEYSCGNWKFLNTEGSPYSQYSAYSRQPPHGESSPYSYYAVNGRLKIFCIIRRFPLRKKFEAIPDVDSLTSREKKSESENEVANQNDEKNDVPEVTGVDRLIQNFKNLLHDEESSDIILKTSDREFRAHRLILRARSPVFASMLQHDMAEKNSGEVDIPDCLAAAFEVFLLYVYTGSADTMSPDNIINLYCTADKYRVDDLKSECVEYMKNTLSVETFCEVISLSLQHGESDLQKAATCFFCKNVKKIVKTVQWQRYVKDYPTEANELFIKVVNA